MGHGGPAVIDDVVLVALIVGAFGLITGLIAPIIIVWLTAKNAKAAKEEDFARQDAVAAAAKEASEALIHQQADVAARAEKAAQEVAVKAEETQRLILARQQAVADQAAEAARLLITSNATVAAAAQEVARSTHVKLDVIHTLVNSNMTAAMQDSLDSTTRELATLRELQRLVSVAGRPPDPATIGAIAAAEAKIAELQAALEDRAKAQEMVASETQAAD